MRVRTQAGDAHVAVALEDDLAEFSAAERVEIEGSSLIRSVFKHLHHIGEYEHGRGREFEVNRKKNNESSLFIPFERAMGARMDLKFDGCISLFWNRLIVMEFLRGYIDCPKSAGILDKSIYYRLRCNEFVALLRANVLWKYLFSDPFRWLSGKTAKIAGWSLVKMAWVLNLVEKGMEKGVRYVLIKSFKSIPAAFAELIALDDEWQRPSMLLRMSAGAQDEWEKHKAQRGGTMLTTDHPYLTKQEMGVN